MIDVTRATFEAELIQASMTTPVLVDFWHPKSEQCKIIVPLLEKLEMEYAGRFILAKVDASQEQEIAQAFGVQSIPTCILMMDGKPVDGFQGAVPEDKLKEFLDKHLPPAAEPEAREPATAEFAEITPETSEKALEKLVEKLKVAPEDETARFDLVKLLMILGRDDDAKIAFAPVIAKTSVVRKFDSLKRWMDAIDTMHLIALQAVNTPAIAINDDENALSKCLKGFDAKIAANKRDFEARFAKTQLLMAQQRWTEAMDELLEILMRDKAWNDDQARKTYIAILDIIEPAPVKVADGQIPPVDPVVATYRRRLSSVVLS